MIICNYVIATNLFMSNLGYPEHKKTFLSEARHGLIPVVATTQRPRWESGSSEQNISLSSVRVKAWKSADSPLGFTETKEIYLAYEKFL